MWDPYLDFDEESIDFFKAYYGDAWKDLYLCMKELDRPFRDNDYILLPIYMGNNYYYTLEDWVFAFEQFNKALDKVKDQKKYYDRVLFDLLCLQAGVFVSDIKMQDEIIKSGCLRIDMKDFLPLLDYFDTVTKKCFFQCFFAYDFILSQ